MMKRVLVLLSLLGVAGCATAAQQESARLTQTNAEGVKAATACFDRVKASEPYQALKDKFGGDGQSSLAMKTNAEKATPAEARLVLALHQEYLMPCRKMNLENFGKVHPSIAMALAENYTKADANYAALVTYKETWGEFVTERDALGVQLQARLASASAAINRDLNASHNTEVAQRQAAAAALQNWAYQQQVLLQNQQAINAANRPRMTNCQYVGTYLNCTTF
jgi:hypothetical protein